LDSQLAQAEAKGAREAGVEVDVFQVPETLPAEVLAKMHAPPKSDDKIADYSVVGTLKVTHAAIAVSFAASGLVEVDLFVAHL
jgi:multimeric flavodoxin WrbA